MNHFKLTQEGAEILDDIIQFMFDFRLETGLPDFHAASYEEHRTKNGLRKLSQEEIDALLKISYGYMKEDEFNPFSGELAKLHLTPNATPFRAFGGFREVFKIEERKNSFEEQLRKSTLDTNTSVEDTNKSIKNLYDKVLPDNFKSQDIATYISIGVGVISLIFIGLSTYYQATDKTATEVQTLKETIVETQQKLQTIQSSLKEINSSIQTKKIDTVFVKTK